MNLLEYKGSIDTYLTANPRITFFKNVYKRYANFAKEDRQIFNGKINMNEQTFSLKKDSDLINGIFLIIDLEKNVDYKNDIEKYIIDSAEIYFDDTCIQKLTKHYRNITNKLLFKRCNTQKNRQSNFRQFAILVF
jgi:hypothetical protein